MSDVFRDLCAELADRLQHAITSSKADRFYGEDRDALDRARAALAEGAGVGPSEWELDDVFFRYCFVDDFGNDYLNCEAFRDAASAVLARYGTTHPRPIPVVKGDILLQAVKSYIEETEVRSDGEWGSCRTLRELLDARLMPDVYWQVLDSLVDEVDKEPTGTHPRPVPVAERLPTAADCDAEGRCWWLKQAANPDHDLLTPTWHLQRQGPAGTRFFRFTHWLPAAAIPLPTVELPDPNNAEPND